MEAIDSDSLYEAKTATSRLLVDHASAAHAELFDDDRRVAYILRHEAERRLRQV
jgi:hypothetical protein